MTARRGSFAGLVALAVLSAATAAPPPPPAPFASPPPPSTPPPPSAVDLDPPPAQQSPPPGLPSPPLPLFTPPPPATVLVPPPPFGDPSLSPSYPPLTLPPPPPMVQPSLNHPPPPRAVPTARPTLRPQPRPHAVPHPQPHAAPHAKPHPKPVSRPKPHAPPKKKKPTKPTAVVLQENSSKYRVKGPGRRLRNGGVIGQVPITFSDASSRGGTYYLPPGYHGNARPLMVAFHGLDGHGSDMVTTFMPQADKHRFIILGVDSHKIYNWHEANAGTPATDDYYHTLACIDWLQRLPGVKVNHKLVTTAGISMGGAIAAALATRYNVFRQGMVIHSPVKVAQIGTQRTPLWLSTGTRDPDAPPAAAQAFVSQVAKARRTLPRVTYRLYRTGHCATCVPAELEQAMDWWLSHPR